MTELRKKQISNRHFRIKYSELWSRHFGIPLTNKQCQAAKRIGIRQCPVAKCIRL